MEQTELALETILEVVRVKQEVMERPVEYRTGMISSSYAGNFGIREIGDEASEVVLVVVLNMKNEISRSRLNTMMLLHPILPLSVTKTVIIYSCSTARMRLKEKG